MITYPLVIMKDVQTIQDTVVVTFKPSGEFEEHGINVTGKITFAFDFGFLPDPYDGLYARVSETEEHVVVSNFHTYEVVLEITKQPETKVHAY